METKLLLPSENVVRSVAALLIVPVQPYSVVWVGACVGWTLLLF